MKVKQCEACKHYKRIVWTSSYKPKDYHRIGVNHAYGYCALYKSRCLNIKNCDMQKGESGKEECTSDSCDKCDNRFNCTGYQLEWERINESEESEIVGE